jgi:carbamoyltransferase
MIYSLTVKEDKIPEIAAITHLDNTCRIQTVNKKQNEKVFMLIEEFKRMTGTSLVLNTSFNDNGEPIIETPSDAIRAFLNLDIDHLVLGNFILSK